MSPAAAHLIRSLVEAFPVHVSSRLRDQGMAPPDGFDQAVEAGCSWLRAALEEVLSQAPARQRRGPLEIFQEAMRFPTEALAAAGFPPVRRDAGAEAALPGDLFDLAPASSRALGEDVWRAHLAWGFAKAQVMTEPGPVGLVSTNLMDRSRIAAAATRSGRRLVVWDGRGKPFGDEDVPGLTMVDLHVASATSIVEQLSGAGSLVVAYGPHVDRSLLEKARRQGAAQALPRSRFFAGLDRLLAGSGE